MSNQQKNKWFSFFYRTRIRVCKQDIVIVNLSLIFVLLAVMSAPWVAVGGLIAALALGYRFSVEKNAAEFSGDFQEVVREAKQNVRDVMDGNDE